ncbi:universal stress protein [uncultured Jannaschia sp.]|uniref:universal stress protein n=1 Tax=uncultured Jannaschia sp. TaxID=293347 RepID=UPI0026313255|nr:universal stress protein [uncultured Jannaschia sp.]
MFERIMVPVDLHHAAAMEKAVAAAATLAKASGATVSFVSVTAPQPTDVAANPEAFAEVLRDFADRQAKAHDMATGAHPITSHDPRAEIDDLLARAATDLNADLVVMATHAPGIAEYVWPSHGGRLASHSDRSVLLVRGE